MRWHGAAGRDCDAGSPAEEKKKAKREDEVPLYFEPSPFPVRPAALRGAISHSSHCCFFHKMFWEKDMLKKRKQQEKAWGGRGDDKKARGENAVTMFFLFAKEENKGTVERIVTDKR